MAIIGNGITTGAAGLDGMITVSDTQPTIPSNKVWVKETPGEIEIPTVDELEELKGEFESTVDYTESYNTVSGDIVSFDDGVAGKSLHKLLGAIEPVQDLHGQDSPYPAGGGKNLFNFVGSTSSWNGVTLSFNDEVATISGVPTQSGGRLYLKSDNVNLNAGTYKLVCVYTGTVPTIVIQSGSAVIAQVAPASAVSGYQFTLAENASQFNIAFNTTAGDSLNGTAKIMIVASTETDLTYSPYANICPIFGHTGVEVTRIGKNLLENTLTSTSRNGISITINSDKSVTLNGTANGVVSFPCIQSGIPNLQFGETYRLSGCPNGGSDNTFALYGDNGGSVCDYGDGQSFVYDGQVIIGRIRIANGYTCNNLVFKPMVIKGSAAADYEEYMPAITSISWQSKAGTIYGGSVNVASGKLIATHAIADMGALSWNYSSGRMIASISNIKPPLNNFTKANVICSMYPITTSANTEDSNYDKYLGVSRYGDVCVRDLSYIDAASFKTAMSGVQLVYELAEPIEYNLSSRAIKTLSGQNNIWIDTGSITECEYVTATSSVIDKLLPEATDEDLGKALLVKTVEDGKVSEYELGDVREDLSNLAHVVIDTASGDIATFTDGADNQPIQKLVATIEPIQDLHGYENPWPGGSGKNRLKVTATTRTVNGVTFTVNADGTVLVNGTATADTDFILNIYDFDASTTLMLSGCPSGGSTSTYMLWLTGHIAFADVGSGKAQEGISGSKNVAIRIWNDTSVSNLLFKPMLCLATETNPTTFAPYENICPISGHTGLTVARTGFNVWDEEWEVGSIYEDGTDNNNRNDVIRSKGYISVKPGSSYYYNVPQSYYFSYDADKNFIKVLYMSEKGVITMPDNACYLRFRLYPSYGATYNHDISINYPSTDHDYHSGTDNVSIPITWETEAGTVYGGTLDVVSGKMVADKAIAIYTGDSSENWQYRETTSGYWRFLNANGKMIGATPISIDGAVMSAISSQYKFISRSATYYGGDGIGIAAVNTTSLYLYDEQFTTVSELTTYLATHNLQVVYPLATPIEYTLTENELTTLYGQNNVWTDVGEVSVDYPADTKLYIDKKISEAVAALGA